MQTVKCFVVSSVFIKPRRIHGRTDHSTIRALYVWKVCDCSEPPIPAFSSLSCQVLIDRVPTTHRVDVLAQKLIPDNDNNRDARYDHGVFRHRLAKPESPAALLQPSATPGKNFDKATAAIGDVLG
ncbi:MAG TPA: hypothetical protein VEF07_00790 [Candidatus Binataceae bacterium]|nr:hypothetical protein [Candidatus Binataceae bacterium]